MNAAEELGLKRPDIEIHKHFAFPGFLDLSKLEDPRQEDLDKLSIRFQEWRAEEIRQLWYFGQMHKQPIKNYRQCYCYKCQDDNTFRKEDGSWHYRKPKIRIPFRLFVDMCFRHYSLICEDCRKGEQQTNYIKLREEWGYPEEFYYARIENWQCKYDYQKDLKLAMQKFVDNWESMYGILISGSRGTGKTRLACTILNELVEQQGQGFAAYMITLGRLLESANEQSKRKWYIDLSLLVIDDLDKDNLSVNYGKDIFAERIYPIIETRYIKRKATIITSNISHEDWLTHLNAYAKRLGDRFRDYMYRETFGEPSMRGLE